MKQVQILLLFLCGFCQTQGQTSEQTKKKKFTPPSLDSFYNSVKGQRYPSFKAIMPDGKVFSNDSCMGKVTLIHFWFESCLGCREEFPEINILYDSIKGNFHYRFIALTYDAPKSLPDFINTNSISFPVATVHDFDAFGKLRYGMACPSLVILNANGEVAFIGMHAVTKNSNEGMDISINKVLTIMKGLL